MALCLAIPDKQVVSADAAVVDRGPFYGSFFFFFNDPAPPEISPLSLHDALPISSPSRSAGCVAGRGPPNPARNPRRRLRDRKSTRLNSSHTIISYAVFCLKT